MFLLQRCSVVVILALLAATGGCSPAGKLVPVKGKVVLTGGKPLPKFVMGSINLIPVDTSVKGVRSANSSINAETGEFEFTTETLSTANRKRFIGAATGEYKVTVDISTKYPPDNKSRNVVDVKYLNVETTDKTVKIERASDSLVIELDPFVATKKK